MYHSASWLKARVAVAGKQRLAVLPQRLVGMHAAAVVGKSGLGMKVTVLPYWLATLRTMYLYSIMLSADFTSESNFMVDFGLAAGGDFVVMALDDEAAPAAWSATISVRRS